MLPVYASVWLARTFNLTVERLWFALTQVVRILSISALFMVIPFTMDPRQYGVTFRGMGLPDRLAYTLDLSFRFVPTLGRDFQVTLDAQRARGYEVEKVQGGLITQIRKMAPLVVPVTMNAILSGEDITNAMDLRCFGLHKRTWIEQLTVPQLRFRADRFWGIAAGWLYLAFLRRLWGVLGTEGIAKLISFFTKNSEVLNTSQF